MNDDFIVAVKVGGDYACFTRPEFKVERVSYPCMTPSAARGILEAIYWKPEFRWEIREIHLLKPTRQISILRNEIETRQSADSGPVFVEDKRQQRASLVLRDVEYVIRAEPCSQAHDPHGPRKHVECFNRRVARGQCHHAPSLGCREFAAWFERPTGEESPADIQQHVGQMLFDIAFIPDKDRQETCFYRKTSDGERREMRGFAEAIFFPAHIGVQRPGVLTVPEQLYGTKYKMEAGT